MVPSTLRWPSESALPGTRSLFVVLTILLALSISLSLCPDNLGTNTYSSALLCGEKCAQLIADEMGLKFKIPHVPEEFRI